MKFIKVFRCLFFLMIFGAGNAWGQTWLWGKTPITHGQYSGGDSYLGGIDPCNNTYLTGEFWDSLVFGNITLYTNSIYATLFVVKYDPNGNVLWANQASVPNDSAYSGTAAFVTDCLGNYFFASGGSNNVIYQGWNISNGYGYTLVKCDYNGNVLWVSKPKSNIFYTRCMTTDSKGNLYVSGVYGDTLFVGNDTLINLSGGQFLIKYTPTGNIIWVKNIPWPYNNTIWAISVDKNGYIYGTGGIGMSVVEFIMMKFDSSGNRLWYKASPSVPVSNAAGGNIIADNWGNLYISGNFSDTLNFGGKQIYSKYRDIFLMKCDTSGNVKWLKGILVIDTCILIPFGFAKDNQDNLYLSGSIGTYAKKGKGIEMLIGTDTLFLDEGTDPSFIEKFDSAGNGLCGSLLKSGGDDAITVDVDSTGNYVYLGGDLMDTLIFAKDTIDNWTSETPFVARWGKCLNDVVLTLSGCHVYECSGSCNDSATVFPFGGITPYTYLWNTSPPQTTQTAKGMCVGTWQVLVKDSKGDSSYLYFAIDKFPNNLSLKTNLDSICPGSNTTLVGTGLITYSWSPNTSINCDTCPSPIASPTATTTYFATGLDSLGCHDTNSITVYLRAKPNGNISGKQFICPAQSATITASGGSIYLWNTGDTNSTITVTPVSNTSYSVSISNGTCAVNDSTTVIINPIPIVNLCCDSLIVHGGSVQLISSGGQNFQWSPTTGLSCDTCQNPMAMPNSTTTYTLTVISDSGCVTSRTVTVEVTCGDVFIPTAFSPSEAHNTKLFVRGPCISTMDFMVFDRWGNKVFESQNPDFGWDGTYKGYPMNMGTYVWYVKATLLDGASIEKKGNVALVR